MKAKNVGTMLILGYMIGLVMTIISTREHVVTGIIGIIAGYGTTMFLIAKSLTKFEPEEELDKQVKEANKAIKRKFGKRK